MNKLFKEIYENPMRNLNNVTRYSGVFCMKPETDGYHTIDMMAMCMKITEIVEEDQSHLENPIKIDRRDLIYKCYLHDMDESLMGDISRNIKYFNDDIYNSINKVVNSLMKSSFPEEIINDINLSKDKDDVCGLIVKLSDTLQSSIKIYDECKLGNFHFRKIIEENKIFVNNLITVVKSSNLSSSKDESIKLFINTLLNIISEFEFELDNEIENYLSI